MICEIKEACLGGLYVKCINSNLVSFELEGFVIDVAEARKANDDNWYEIAVEYQQRPQAPRKRKQ